MEKIYYKPLSLTYTYPYLYKSSFITIVKKWGCELTEWIRLAAKPHVSAACAITGSILPLILMHLYPLPLKGFSGNQWSRYLRLRTSTIAALNFSSCCSLTEGLRLPNLKIVLKMHEVSNLTTAISLHQTQR